MKKLFLIAVLLFSFLAAAQNDSEFTKEYHFAQAVIKGVHTEISEEINYVTFNLGGENKLKMETIDGKFVILDQVTPIKYNEEGEQTAVFESETGVQMLMELSPSGERVRFVFSDNDYVQLFNFIK